MGGQGLTAGCNAVGVMKWQVLLFNAIQCNIYQSLNAPYKNPHPPVSVTTRFLEIIFTFKFLAPRSSQTLENVMDQQLFEVPLLVQVPS